MEVEDCRAELVLIVARKYFPMITLTSFNEVFKMTALQVATHLESFGKLDLVDYSVRNFLILLYWARHYPSMRTIAALFGLSKTHVCDVIHSLLSEYCGLYPTFVNFDRVDILPDFFLPWTVGVVDGTEILIQSWIPVCISLLFESFSLVGQLFRESERFHYQVPSSHWFSRSQSDSLCRPIFGQGT